MLCRVVQPGDCMSILERVRSAQLMVPCSTAVSTHSAVQVRHACLVSVTDVLVSEGCCLVRSTNAHQPVAASMLTGASSQVVYEDDHLACVVKPQMMQVDTPPHSCRGAANDKVVSPLFMHMSRS